MAVIRPDVTRGAAAGTLATLFMSSLMLLGRRAGLMGSMPPEKITTRFLRGTGFHPDRRQRNLAASVAHVGFGAAGGVGFSAFNLRGRTVPAALLLGLAYGTAVWAVSYLGWVPALGIMPPADRDRPGRPQTMLAAHWLYGAALGLLLRR